MVFINGRAIDELIQNLRDDEEAEAPFLGAVEAWQGDTLGDEGGAAIREVDADFMGIDGGPDGDGVVGVIFVGVLDDVGGYLIGGKLHTFHRIVRDTGEDVS